MTVGPSFKKSTAIESNHTDLAKPWLAASTLFTQPGLSYMTWLPQTMNIDLSICELVWWGWSVLDAGLVILSCADRNFMPRTCIVFT